MNEIEIPKPNINTESSLVRSADRKINIKKNENEKSKLKGKVTIKNPSFGEKLKRSFVKEDLHDIRDYVVFDIVLPSIKSAIFNTIVGTAGQIFGISVPSNTFRFSNGYNGRQILTQHERKYRDFNSIQREDRSMIKLNRYDRFYVSDFEFEYQEEADSVLEQLMDICDSRGWVSVAKFFEIADPDGTIEGKNVYTNNNFGWKEIDNASVKFNGEGYVIIMPPAKPKN